MKSFGIYPAILILMVISTNGTTGYDDYDEEIKAKFLSFLKSRGINITNTIVVDQKPGNPPFNMIINNEVGPRPTVVKPFITEVVTSRPLPGELVDSQLIVISSSGKPTVISQRPVTPKPIVVSSQLNVQPAKPTNVKPSNTKPTAVVTSKPVTSKPSVTQKPTGSKLNATSVTAAVQVETTTRTPFFRNPCQCLNGICTCCTGRILETFNQKACLKVTYEPDDFAFTAVMMLNDRVFFKRKVSGKNPPPMCLRIPRLQAVKLCMRFANVYFSGTNMHTCINFEASFQDFTIIDTSLDCIRIGTNGIASVQPEDGGGVSIIDEDDDIDIEDYDDSA